MKEDNSKESLKMSRQASQVILDIFSGRVNPSWNLASEQVDELKSMLTDVSPSKSVQVPILGYRGFIIRNSGGDPTLPDEIIVYKHVLTITQGTEISFKRDDKNIEDWLLNQARKLGFGEVIEKFDISPNSNA